MPTFTTEGVRRFYRVEGKGQPVILIHGLGGDHTAWEGPVLDAMRACRTVVRMDLRGHGRSGRGRALASSKQHAHDVAALLSLLGNKQVPVLGVSMGGTVAMALAHQYSQRVAALALISTWAACDAHVRACFLEWEAASRASRKVLQDVALIRSATPEYVAANPALIARFRRAWPTNHGPAFRAACRACIEHDARGYLDKITVPALVVAGDRAIFIPPTLSRFLARALPNARLRRVRGGGHVPWLDAPEEMVSVVQAFLRRGGR